MPELLELKTYDGVELEKLDLRGSHVFLLPICCVGFGANSFRAVSGWPG